MTQELLDGLDQFWRTRFLSDTKTLPPDRYEKILPYIRQWGEGGIGLNNIEGYEAFSAIIGIQERGTRHFGELDFLISPVSPEPAFPAEWPSPSRDPARTFERIGFTVAYNMTGQPAASINCGFTADGLPIGLQIVGRRFDDLGVLRLAKIWEEVAPDKRPWPRIGN